MLVLYFCYCFISFFKWSVIRNVRFLMQFLNLQFKAVNSPVFLDSPAHLRGNQTTPLDSLHKFTKNFMAENTYYPMPCLPCTFDCRGYRWNFE